jgi:hypothetical protein
LESWPARASRGKAVRALVPKPIERRFAVIADGGFAPSADMSFREREDFKG